MKTLKIIASLVAVLLLAPMAMADSAIYLVRHAEKLADTDPGLTEKGLARAQALAARLSKAKLVKIYSTDTKRTRMTAAPTAEAHRLGVALYDPRTGFQDYANALKGEFMAGEGDILVVGHSNTTPYLASLLTGEQHDMLRDDQYSHLFIITPTEDGGLKATIEYFDP